MRVKMESISELAAFTSAAREYKRRYVSPRVAPSSTSQLCRKEGHLPRLSGRRRYRCGRRGRRPHTWARRDSRTTKHGRRLAALGIPVDLDPDQVTSGRRVKRTGLSRYRALSSSAREFLRLRQDLGVRSFFHPVAKMLNPARAPVQMIGVTHPPYFEKTAEASNMLGSRRVVGGTRRGRRSGTLHCLEPAEYWT